MGIEMILFLVLGQLVEASVFLQQNAGLILGTSLFLILFATGAITTMRRWRAE